MTATNLLATCWTHAGDASPRKDSLFSKEKFQDRARYVAEAGFNGIGFLMEDISRSRYDLSLVEMRQILDNYSFEYIELEFIENWWTNDPKAAAYRRDIFEAARILGARHVKASPSIVMNAEHDMEQLDMGVYSRKFYELGVEAEQAGVRIALEFIPMSNIPDLATALELIERANHPALGLCIDIWHVERGATTINELHQLPPELIVAVELNDATREVQGTLFDDTVDSRLDCGTGDFDLLNFIRALHSTGFAGPWGVEIISSTHRQTALPVAVKRAYRHASLSVSNALNL